MHSPSSATPETLEGFELAPQQQRFLRWQQQRLAKPAQRARLCLLLPADTHPTQLYQSLLEVIDRHEILRTSYRRLPGMRDPLQVIDPTPSLHWRLVGSDDSAVSEPHRTEGAVTVVVERAADGLAVSLEIEAAHADAASLLRVAADWCSAYRADLGEAPVPQYADYAAWRTELMSSDGEAAEFWQRELSRRLPAIRLPLRGPLEHAEGECDLAQLRIPLGVDQVARVQARAADLASDPALLVLTAWSALLHQHSEAEQLTLALDWQTRSPQLEAAIGLYSEPLPLTLRGLNTVTADALAAQLAARVAELESQRDAFPSLRDEASARLGFRYVPSIANPVIETAGWRIEFVEGAPAPHALSLEHVAHSGGFQLVLRYDRNAYDAATVALLADQLTVLIDGVCEHPAAALGELSALSAAERHACVASLGVSDPLPDKRQRLYERVAALPNLVACFREPLERNAHRHAVADATRSLSYAELEVESARIGQQLLAQGARVGTRVGHFLPREVDAIAAMLGILRAGAVYVPIDPNYPEERVAYLLQDSNVQFIVTRRDLARKLPAKTRETIRLLFTDAPETSGEAAAGSVLQWPEIAPECAAYLIYTSGSTGRPRGVVISHANALYSLAARLAYYPDPIERFLLLSSFAFDSSIAGLFGTLAQGGCLYVCSEAEQKDPAQLADILCEQRISHLLALPSLYQLLLTKLVGRPHALTAAIVAGEACPRALLAEHRRVAPQARLYNEYGATEASVWSTVGECVGPTSSATEPAHRPGEAWRPVSIGRPIPHTHVYVLDARDQPSARGLKGEICVAGPGLSAGYLGHPDLTQQKFVTLHGRRLYRTGDYGYWDERGELVFLGRADSQVKIRGYRIELGEVEAALRRVTGAEQVAVLTDRREDDDIFLRGFVEADAELEAEHIRAAMAKLVPEPMIPADVQTLARFPQTANGKLDRRALLALKRRTSRRPYVEPCTPVELALQKLWSELLGGEAPGRDDDFFALGGHSLLAVRLVHRIESTLGLALPVSKVFEHPKLAALAAQLEAPSTDPASSGTVVRLGASGASELSLPLFCVDPTGIHVDVYADLAAALASSHGVTGLALGPSLVAAGSSVERIARHLVQALRTAQPHGPYRLLGWSLGGALAVAIAHTLEQDGAAVSFLGVLDSQPPLRVYARGEPDPIDELAAYVDRERQPALLALPAKERDALRAQLATHEPPQRIGAAIAWAQRHGFITDQADPKAFMQRYALLSGAARYLNALPERALSARIHIWWTKETLDHHGGAPVDWRRYSRNGGTEAFVAGNHAAPLRSAEVHLRIRTLLEGK
jgi:amino acid adenylation domain-containing protein